MIKVPSTPEGLPAITTLISEGIDTGESIPSWPAEAAALIEVVLEAISVDRLPRPDESELGLTRSKTTANLWARPRPTPGGQRAH